MTVVELPRHSVEMFMRCPRKWYYRHKLGLVKKTEPPAIIIGNLFHAGASSIYRTIRDGGLGAVEDLSVEFSRAFTEVPNATPEQQQLALDMLIFWWTKSGLQHLDRMQNILHVEETMYLRVGEFLVPATPDVVFRSKENVLWVDDHKTTGNIKDALTFLPIDFQLKRYAATLYQEYNEVPNLGYNMVRRSLPPDFEDTLGNHPYALTKTGRKSTKTTNIVDYLRYEQITFTPKQINAFLKELHDILLDLTQADQNDRFTRRVIKGGTYGCSSCEYFGPCAREFDGNKIDGLALAFEYDREDPTPKIGVELSAPGGTGA